MLKGLKDLIKKETNVPVFLVERPLECVAKGAGILLEEIDTMKILQNDKKSKVNRW